MIGLHVGDHGDDRRELEKRAVVLIRLRDEVVPVSQSRVGPEDVDPPSHDDRRIEAGLRQDHPRQRGRGRLAVGPRDRDPLLQAHDLSEHLGAPDDRNPPRAGRGDLGVLLAHGRRDDQEVRVVHVARIVPPSHPGTQLFEAGGVFREGEIAARDLERGGEQEDLGEPAHADPARADEMETTQAQEPHRDASASKSSRASTGTACCRRR